MKKTFNIAVVGLGQIGSYLLNELNTKKKEIQNKTGKQISIVAISARNKNKKRPFKINKKIFYSNPLRIIKEKKIDILFEVIGTSDGISKKIVETALKNKIHVITPNKALISKHGNELAKVAEKFGVRYLFTSTPFMKVKYVGQCAVIGRYGIKNSTPINMILKLAKGDVKTWLYQKIIWDTKKIVQSLLGNNYSILRKYYYKLK